MLQRVPAGAETRGRHQTRSVAPTGAPSRAGRHACVGGFPLRQPCQPTPAHTIVRSCQRTHCWTRACEAARKISACAPRDGGRGRLTHAVARAAAWRISALRAQPLDAIQVSQRAAGAHQPCRRLTSYGKFNGRRVPEWRRATCVTCLCSPAPRPESTRRTCLDALGSRAHPSPSAGEIIGEFRGASRAPRGEIHVPHVKIGPFSSHKRI